MNVTSFRLRMPNGATVFELDVGPTEEPSGYILKSAQGLDVGAISPVGYGFSSVSGDPFTSMNLEPRVIDLTIGLNPYYTGDDTYTGLRWAIYNAIASSRTPDVIFELMYLNLPIGTLTGQITKIDGEYFTNEPEITVSITCKDPYFKAYTDTTVTPMLTGNRLDIQVYEPTAPTGMNINLVFTNAVSEWEIKDGVFDHWEFRILHNFNAGDALHISSERDALEVSYIPSGTTTHVYVADAIQTGSIWPILFSGSNTFLLSDPANYTFQGIYYRPRYWGI